LDILPNSKDVTIHRFSKTGLIFTRSYSVGEVRWSTDPTGWDTLSEPARDEFIKRTERAVFSDVLKSRIDAAPNVLTRAGLVYHLEFGATTIAAIYKDRRQFELLFKALKQHLKIKTFVGTSATALHTQIWTALIGLLLLKYLQLRSTFGWSLSNLVALLQFQLFTHRDLWAWLNEPFTGPPTIEPAEQLVLTAAA